MDAHWWKKRTIRTVDNLKLWVDNPRLEETEDGYPTFKALAESFVSNIIDINKFKVLARSIVNEGFIDFEPIITWKNEKDRYMVAEGNRRVLILKLLRSPHKSPFIIRKFMMDMSKKIDPTSIEKIDVCVAPDKESTISYIIRRHTPSETHFRWDRGQQHRYIADLYEEFNQDIDKVKELTKLPITDINEAIRFAILRDLATNFVVINKLSETERERVYSKNIPITILERWFSSALVKEKWGISFDGAKVLLTSDKNSFLEAYAEFLKFVFNEDKAQEEFDTKVDTRFLNGENYERLLNALPLVKVPEDASKTPINVEDAPEKPEEDSTPAAVAPQEPPAKKSLQPPKTRRNDVSRIRIVHSSAKINVSSAKLIDVFLAMKNLPVKTHTCAASVLLRVFLDLSVSEYLKENDDISKLTAIHKTTFAKIPLDKRLKYIEDNIDKNDHDKVHIINLIQQLRNKTNDHSLNTLNNYIHSHDTFKMEARFICGFWDMLTPLFSSLIEYRDS